MDDATRQYTQDQAPRIRAMLLVREAQMQELLNSSGSMGAALQASSGDGVHDFKDMAGEETQAVVDAAQAAHAVRELQALHAALRRLDVHGYGLCAQCGDAINMRRLEAMPATALCTSCQAEREHEQATAQRQRGGPPLPGIAADGGVA